MSTVCTADNASSLLYTGKVLIKFHARWCAPCKAMSASFEELSLSSTTKNVRFLTVDVDDEPALADQFDVTAVPTLLLLSEGKVVHTFHSVDDCKEYLESKLS